jgi:hypothetical protein
MERMEMRKGERREWEKRGGGEMSYEGDEEGVGGGRRERG